MSGGAQTLLVVVLCLVPGALCTGFYNWVVGSYRHGALSHYFVQLVCVSAAMIAPVAWPIYHSGRWDDITGGSLGWWVALLSTIVYLSVPAGVGLFVGRAVRRSWRIARWYRKIPSTAWDDIFRRIDDKGVAVVYGLLKDGKWVAGLFATRRDGLKSYASSYPEPEQVLLVLEIEIDTAGDFVKTDDGQYILKENSILLKHDELKFLQVEDIQEGSKGVQEEE